MKTAVLQRYTQANELAAKQDISTPYTFMEWKARNYGIIANKDYEQYNQYCINWYRDHKLPIDTKSVIKQQYIALLRELTVIFKDEFLNLDEINFDDDLELESLIPYYTRKLKLIAIYLTNKREVIKLAKLKYNLVGSTHALEHLFYNYLLTAFTNGSHSLSLPSSAVPDLSSVNTDFSISVEELFDDITYFDKDPSVQIGNYYNLLDGTTNAYYSTLGIEPSAAFSTGVYPLSTPDIGQKYLGETSYTVQGGFYIPNYTEFTINISIGNNWFYWPIGGNYGTKDNFTYQTLPLSASQFTTLGAAGSSLDTSDKFFIRKGNKWEGAWLKHETSTTEVKEMVAILDKGAPTTFSFPYPGFGLSGTDFAWTGKTLSNASKSFELLSNTLKEAVLAEYWTTTIDNQSVLPININDTTLVDQGATAAKNYLDADKITVRNIEESENEVLPRTYAWLYKFTTTQIPIALGKNQILWPLKRIDDISTTSTMVPTTCSPISLLTLNLEGSTAGASLSSSDTIFKVDTYESGITEVAWLSGANTSVIGSPQSFIYDGTIQENFGISVLPGEFIVFLWTDNPVDINQVFTQRSHATDCPYVVEPKVTQSLEKDLVNKTVQPGATRWNHCTCGAFNYSPCGHSGNRSDFHGIHDFIIEDFNYPNAFNLNTWSDRPTFKRFDTSNYFAWYKTTKNGIHYGDGNWVTPSGQPFTLQRGHIYRYFRTNGHRDADEVPNYIAKYKHTLNQYKPIWIQAVKDNTGNWVTGSVPQHSNMMLLPGDVFIYNHYDSSITIDSVSTAQAPINFLLQRPLNGWNYDQHKQQANSPGARPFWAKASDLPENTENKAIPVNSSRTIVDNYTIITQPEISDIILESDLYFEYETPNKGLIWKQPVTISTVVDFNRWNTLIFNTAPNDGLSQSALTATDLPSQIEITSSYNGEPTHINYYAQKDLIFTQQLIDTTLGVPPTGGLWVPTVSGTSIEAKLPYMNLTNRHFPTVASAPSLGELYTENQVGGYFTANGLGVSTYIGKNYQIDFDYDK